MTSRRIVFEQAGLLSLASCVAGERWEPRQLYRSSAPSAWRRCSNSYAPDLSYQLKDGAAEWLSGSRGRTFRIATGSTAGSSYRVGTVLNKYLRARSGYELELVGTAAPGNVGAMLNPRQHIDLAIINSSDDDAAREEGVSGLAALELQYLFVIVPNESTVHEVRDLTGAVNPGIREPGQPATVGERVLESLRAHRPSVGAGRFQRPCECGPAHSTRERRGLRGRSHDCCDAHAVLSLGSDRGDLQERPLSRGRDPRSRSAGPIDSGHPSWIHSPGLVQVRNEDPSGAGPHHRRHGTADRSRGSSRTSRPRHPRRHLRSALRPRRSVQT